MKTQLLTMYLDWVNNWLTVDAFSDHYELDHRDAISLIDMGRKYHEEQAQ
mgnify:FL=1|jgi:hypothetical protein